MSFEKFLTVPVFILLLLSFTNYLNAQETSFDKGKKYILGGIEVTGVKGYNEQTVITYTGLRTGQEITVPGEQISEVISKLWGLNLFSDIKSIGENGFSNPGGIGIYGESL